jgi:hypothetical protein
MKRIIWAIAVGVGLIGLGAPTHAALFERPKGLIYDDVLDITWVQDANLWGQTGAWDQAVAWAASLEYAGYDDWRLAAISVAAGLPTGATNSVVDCRFATEAVCRDNELGYMFFQNLKGTIGDDLTGDQTVGTVKLLGIQADYWSSTQLASDSAVARGFDFDSGFQDVDLKINLYAAWAVRAGDIVNVPLPASLPLLFFGFAGMLFVRRRWF